MIPVRHGQHRRVLLSHQAVNTEGPHPDFGIHFAKVHMVLVRVQNSIFLGTSNRGQEVIRRNQKQKSSHMMPIRAFVITEWKRQTTSSDSKSFCQFTILMTLSVFYFSISMLLVKHFLFVTPLRSPRTILLDLSVLHLVSLLSLFRFLDHSYA